MADKVYVVDNETGRLLDETARAEEIYDYTFTPNGSSEKGEGYCGDITYVDIVGTDAEKKDRTLSVVLKTATKSDALRNVATIEEVFKRELYFYQTVVPAFSTFEVQKGIVCPSKFAPKCYTGQTTYKYEIIVLENLKENGFMLCDPKRTMDEKHVGLVMRKYGRLHALSFALRDQDPKKYGEITDSMYDLYMTCLRDTDFKYHFIEKCNNAVESLDKERNVELIKVYKEFADNVLDFFLELLYVKENYSVVLHGDCWTNNILFKYEDENDDTNPTDLRFIDFQTSRLGSPVLDLSYFFYACSSEDIINNKLHHYLQIYHNSLAEHLKNLGSDVEQVFPYTVLEEHWKKYGRYGLILSILVIYLMLSAKSENVDMSERVDSGIEIKDVFSYNMSNIQEYHRRIRGIIVHCAKNSII